MRVLITGGLGYIGSHLSIQLIKKNYRVTIIDNLSNSKILTRNIIKKITKKNFLFKKLDLLNFSKLNKFFKNNKFDIVFHLAGLKSVREGELKPSKYILNNVTGSENLLRAMLENNVRKIVFSSSATVYGKKKNTVYRENMRLSPINIYGHTKKSIEDLIKKLKNEKKINYVILRYFNPAGCHSSGLIGEEPKGIPENLFAFITKIIQGNFKYLNIYGKSYQTKDGTGARDYIHIEDLVNAHIKSIKIVNKKKSDILNIGSGKAYTVLEIINSFKKKTNFKIRFKFKKKRKGDLAKYLTNNYKAKKIINWQPKKSIDDICTSIYKYAKANIR